MADQPVVTGANTSFQPRSVCPSSVPTSLTTSGQVSDPHGDLTKSIPDSLRSIDHAVLVVETDRTVKNILDHWRIESIILFLYVDPLELFKV
jgi:hypothetical protein